VKVAAKSVDIFNVFSLFLSLQFFEKILNYATYLSNGKFTFNGNRCLRERIAII
jgi:hypothetical protein